MIQDLQSKNKKIQYMEKEIQQLKNEYENYKQHNSEKLKNLKEEI